MGKKHQHLGFKRLEMKIERSEEKAHPSYPHQRIHYIATAKAGEIATARKRAGKRG